MLTMNRIFFLLCVEQSTNHCITQLLGSCQVTAAFIRGSGTHTHIVETIRALLALLLVNKPALKLPNKPCLSVANSRDSLLKLMDCICTHSFSSRAVAWQWECIVRPCNLWTCTPTRKDFSWTVQAEIYNGLPNFPFHIWVDDSLWLCILPISQHQLTWLLTQHGFHT